VYSSSQGCHTATGTHVPQCYLPPGRGDIPALNPVEAGTRLSDPGGMQGWVDLVVSCLPRYVPTACQRVMEYCTCCTVTALRSACCVCVNNCVLVIIHSLISVNCLAVLPNCNVSCWFQLLRFVCITKLVASCVLIVRLSFHLWCSPYQKCDCIYTCIHTTIIRYKKSI